MTLQEIRESGLLELYVLGQLNDQEKSLVELTIEKFPVLKQDLFEIEKALEMFGKAHAIPAPKSVLDSVLKEIKKGPSDLAQPNRNVVHDSKPSLWTRLQPAFSLLAMLGLCMFLYFNHNKLEETTKEYERKLIECNEQNQRIAILESLNDRSNRVILAEATAIYPETLLYFNHNPETQKNFIQVQNLPALASNQSYQLWSLKGDSPPIPLNVFQDDIDNIFEVDFIEGNDAYAITVEPIGGTEVPTLANLVAVIKMS